MLLCPFFILLCLVAPWCFRSAAIFVGGRQFRLPVKKAEVRSLDPTDEPIYPDEIRLLLFDHLLLPLTVVHSFSYNPPVFVFSFFVFSVFFPFSSIYIFLLLFFFSFLLLKYIVLFLVTELIQPLASVFSQCYDFFFIYLFSSRVLPFIPTILT